MWVWLRLANSRMQTGHRQSASSIEHNVIARETPPMPALPASAPEALRLRRIPRSRHGSAQAEPDFEKRVERPRPLGAAPDDLTRERSSR
jgi:hypothetical protein